MTPGQYILVVDDDDDFREALSEVLAEAGYPVQQAENGEVALSRAEDEQPGIVLLDLKMPVLDGWGVMERMRGDPRSAAVPILILSAYGFEWEAELLGAQAMFHGHAHHGGLEGRTPRGVAVYNVAIPVLRRLMDDRRFRVVELEVRAGDHGVVEESWAH